EFALRDELLDVSIPDDSQRAPSSRGLSGARAATQFLQALGTGREGELAVARGVIDRNWEVLLNPPQTADPVLRDLNREVQVAMVGVYQTGDLLHHYQSNRLDAVALSLQQQGGLPPDQQKIVDQQQAQQSRASVFLETIGDLIKTESDPARKAMLETQMRTVVTDIQVGSREFLNEARGDLAMGNPTINPAPELMQALILAASINNPDIARFIPPEQRQQQQLLLDESQGLVQEYQSSRAANSLPPIVERRTTAAMQGQLAVMAGFDPERQIQLFGDMRRTLQQREALLEYSASTLREATSWYEESPGLIAGRARAEANRQSNDGQLLADTIYAMPEGNRDRAVNTIIEEFRAASERQIQAENRLTVNQNDFSDVFFFAIGNREKAPARAQAEMTLSDTNSQGFLLVRAAADQIARRSQKDIARRDAETRQEITNIEAIPSRLRTAEQNNALEAARARIIDHQLERQNLRDLESEVLSSTSAEGRRKQAESSTFGAQSARLADGLVVSYGIVQGLTELKEGEIDYEDWGVRLFGATAGTAISTLSQATLNTGITVVKDLYGRSVGDRVEGTALDFLSHASQSRENRRSVQNGMRAQQAQDITVSVVQGLSEDLRDLRRAKDIVDGAAREVEYQLGQVISQTPQREELRRRLLNGETLRDDERQSLGRAIELAAQQLSPQIREQLREQGVSEQEFLRSALNTIMLADAGRDGGIYHEVRTQDSLAEIEILALKGRREAKQNLDAINGFTSGQFEFRPGDIINPAGAATKLGLRLRSSGLIGLISPLVQLTGLAGPEGEYAEQLIQAREQEQFLRSVDRIIEEAHEMARQNPDVTLSDVLDELDSVTRERFNRGAATGRSETLGRLEIRERLRRANVLDTATGQRALRAQEETLQANVALVSLAAGDTQGFAEHAAQTGQEEFARYAKN
ncbi:MAG TPA: hypothetical protein VJH22_05170, partial [Candidatus Nanoarchaeia archaeon]|nr:hypothetical protein [Candidatus Nanoarchaeia archaeon]